MLKIHKQLVLLATIIVIHLFSPIANAHPGNTAADGCHYCRTNCDSWGVAWNQRHCHGGSTIKSGGTSNSTDIEAQKMVDYLNSPEGKKKGEEFMESFSKPEPTTTKVLDRAVESKSEDSYIPNLLAVGGLGFGAYQWLKNKKD